MLSGGGAKGIAHVGALKALEENNIPVDYIVGTSMGGIVGGMYAAGYSPSEIEYIINTDEFQTWARGQLEENFTYTYNANRNNPTLVRLQLSYDSTLQMHLNSSLVDDASLNFAMAQLLAQPSAAANYNFDSLLVPFRSVAADIYTQRQVVLDQGQLADAVRATMTVPLFFRPIKINRKQLYDGGLYNNFPVDVMQEEFKPDLIIGVNVSSKIYNEYPYDKDNTDLPQTLLYAMMSNSDSTALSPEDIYIQPNVGTFTAMDFNQVSTLFESGYKATIAEMPEIKKRISREVTPEQKAASRARFREKFDPLHFDSIGISGLDELQTQYVRNHFRRNAGGGYSMKEIKQGYFRLASADNFYNLYPSIHFKEQEQKYDFNLDLKSNSDLSVGLGGVLASRPIDFIYASAEYNLLRRYLYTFAGSFYTGRFYRAAQVRARVNIPAHFPFYIEPNFNYNNWNYISTSGFLLESDKDRQPFLEQADRSYGLELGFTNTYKGKIVLTGSYAEVRDRYSNLLEIQTTDILDRTNFDAYTTALVFERGNLNRRQYASDGHSVTASLRYVNGTEKYNPGSTALVQEPTRNSHEWVKLQVRYENFNGEGAHKWGYLLEGVWSTQPFFSNYRSTLTLSPAFAPLPDSRTLFLDNFRSDRFAAGGLRYIYEAAQRLDLRAEGYVFQPYKRIKESEMQQAYYGGTLSGTSFIASTSAVYHSLLGPVALSLNYYDDPAKRWGVLLHLGYILFQNRPFNY